MLSESLSSLHQKNMGGHNLNFNPIPYLFSIFFFFLLHAPVNAQGNVCANVSCVRGTCVPELIGFDCACDPGWNKIPIGPFTYPACVVPNCTVNLQCGNGAPPPPPPPPSEPPLFNPFSPCNLVWCNDGTCVESGTGYYCKCNEGSTNLFNLTDLACFKTCSFGGDCSKVGLGQHAPPPPSGSDKIFKSWMSCDGSNIVLFSAIILALVL